MECIEYRVGRRNVYLPMGDKLCAVMKKTNDRVNYLKRIAKTRKTYNGEIYEELIILSPTYIYTLEDALSGLGYVNVLHNAILEFSIKEQQIFYTLLREGKSFNHLFHNKNISFEDALNAIQSLFTKVSLKIK